MDYSKLLNIEQLAPVMDTEGAVLVLAGAGSGKTRVLTYRIARLIADLGVSPYNILAITFTNKAAREMAERVAKVTNQQGIWISTFHSLCARILRQDIGVLEGYDGDFSIYSAGDSEKVIKRILADYYIEEEHIKKNVIYHISNAKNSGLTAEEYRQISDFDNSDLVYKVYTQYDKVMRENNALDFDDLMMKTVRIFVTHKEVLTKWQERFQYIHVDEFQDTNTIQMLMIRLLAVKYGNIFVVGDDDQSIYGWRGAKVEHILGFRKQFPTAKIYKLQQNYRSTQLILDCANSVISNNQSRIGKELFTDKGKGIKINYRSLYSDKEEADFVVREISGLCHTGDYTYDNMAILVRLNSLTRKFEEQLQLYGIPYRLFGGFKFYERKEVQDVVAYLKAVINPKDQEAIARVINFPKRGIGDSVMQKLKLYAIEKNLSLLDAIFDVSNISSLNNNQKMKVSEFAAIMSVLTSKKDEQGLSDYIDTVINVSNIKSAYIKSDLDDQVRLDNIDEFVSSVKEYAKQNPSSNLNEYVQTVALMTDTDTQDDSPKVTIATVHAVKGLEYKCVFIVGLEEQIFPSSRAMSSKADEEEERRCMYVAITRAEERLYMTSCQTRFRFGKSESNLVSRFVRECGAIETVKPIVNPSKIDIVIENAIANQLEALERMKATQPTISSNISKELSGYVVGATIVHPRYGEGVIVSRSGEVGLVNFDKLGNKEFNMRVAPVKLKTE